MKIGYVPTEDLRSNTWWSIRIQTTSRGTHICHRHLTVFYTNLTYNYKASTLWSFDTLQHLTVMYTWRTTRLQVPCYKILDLPFNKEITPWYVCACGFFCHPVHHVIEQRHLINCNCDIFKSTVQIRNSVHVCTAVLRYLYADHFLCTPGISQGCMVAGYILQRATGAKVSLQNEEIMIRQANSTVYKKYKRETEFCLLWDSNKLHLLFNRKISSLEDECAHITTHRSIHNYSNNRVHGVHVHKKRS
jgi:hypothetical protein